MFWNRKKREVGEVNRFNMKKLNDMVTEEIGFDDPFCIASCFYCAEKMIEEDKTEESMVEFEKKTGIKHLNRFCWKDRNPIEKLIDNVTGFEKAKNDALYSYCIWYIKEYAKGFKAAEKILKDIHRLEYEYCIGAGEFMC